MSVHSLKSKRRHPDAARDRFEVAHVTFEVVDRSAAREGITFALVAGEAVTANDRRPMFSGFVTADMAAQLRALADHLDPLCAAVGRADDGEGAL